MIKFWTAIKIVLEQAGIKLPSVWSLLASSVGRKLVLAFATWLLTSGGCIWMGRERVQTSYDKGYDAGYRACSNQPQPKPDDGGKKRGIFGWLRATAYPIPDGPEIIEHEPTLAEPEVIDAPGEGDE